MPDPQIPQIRAFLSKWLTTPEAFPDEFKSWLINFVQQNPNLDLDHHQLPGNVVYSGYKVVPSAASIPIQSDVSLISVTGTTNITSLSAGYLGQRITLVFSGVLTVIDGGNLKLAGNFVTTADDTISLMYDGTNWIETSRSVN